MSEQHEVDRGIPGASAQREYQRRRDSRQRNATPTRGLSGLIAGLLGPTAEEKRRAARDNQWAIGARGEEMLAESLARRCPKVLVLHDRRMPGSRANIDHLAVAASGVYVIDTKRHRGKKEVRKPLFGERVLKIDGRDQTKLIHGLAKQVAAVEAALIDFAPDVPTYGCLCFVAPEGLLAVSGLPRFRTLTINDYPLFDPRRLAKRMNGSGPLTPERARSLLEYLARRFPRASAG
jgi:Nuclease-related domain